MHLELKGKEKSGFNDQQHKMNRNVMKEGEYNKGKKERRKKKEEKKSKPHTYCQLRGSEKYDHALQHAIPQSEARAFHQAKKVLHQNRRATQSTAGKHT